MVKQLESFRFEMWCWRRVLRISWVDLRSNEWVRRKAKVEEEKSLLGTDYALTLRKFGHLMRGRPSIVQTAIEGSIEGKRKRGRQKTTRAKKVSEANGKTTISATKRAAMDREK